METGHLTINEAATEVAIKQGKAFLCELLRNVDFERELPERPSTPSPLLTASPRSSNQQTDKLAMSKLVGFYVGKIKDMKVDETGKKGFPAPHIVLEKEFSAEEAAIAVVRGLCTKIASDESIQENFSAILKKMHSEMHIDPEFGTDNLEAMNKELKNLATQIVTSIDKPLNGTIRSLEQLETSAFDKHRSLVSSRVMAQCMPG
jgi:hypothetical protein